MFVFYWFLGGHVDLQEGVDAVAARPPQHFLRRQGTEMQLRQTRVTLHRIAVWSLFWRNFLLICFFAIFFSFLESFRLVICLFDLPLFDRRVLLLCIFLLIKERSAFTSFAARKCLFPALVAPHQVGVLETLFALLFVVRRLQQAGALVLKDARVQG